MKITDVRPIHLRTSPIDQPSRWGYDAFIVQVYTDEGIVGTGASDTNPELAKACILAPHSNTQSIGIKQILIGENPLEIQRLWDKMYNLTRYFGRRGAALHAISAIDIALWDIASQYYQVPIHMLLGGKYRDKIRVYGSVEDGDGKDIDLSVEKAFEFKEAGFHSLKYFIYTADANFEVKRFEAVRGALGEDFELSVDCIAGDWMTYGVAARMIKALEHLNFNWIEEPVPADDMKAYAKLANITGARIAGGEGLTSRYEFKSFIEIAQPDVVQPDITRCGGISEMRKIYDMATLNGCQLVPHDWSTPILLSASVQFLAAVEYGDLFEYCLSESPTFKNLAFNNIPFEDGYVEVPDCIGLGLELDYDFIKKHEVLN